jgi:hypothetical protein
MFFWGLPSRCSGRYVPQLADARPFAAFIKSEDKACIVFIEGGSVWRLTPPLLHIARPEFLTIFAAHFNT